MACVCATHFREERKTRGIFSELNKQKEKREFERKGRKRESAWFSDWQSLKKAKWFWETFKSCWKEWMEKKIGIFKETKNNKM